MSRPSLFQRIALIIVGSLIALLGIIQTIFTFAYGGLVFPILFLIPISIFVFGLVIVLAGILR